MPRYSKPLPNDAVIIQAASNATSITQIMTQLGLSGGTAFKKLKERLVELDLIDKFRYSQFWNRGKSSRTDARINAKVQDPIQKDTISSSTRVKTLLCKENLVDYKCSVCGLTEWCGKSIVLELDHINGDRSNNSLTNLRLLCPNCHSQTPTYKGKNKNNALEKRVSEEDLVLALQKEKSIAAALRQVGLAPKGANYKRCYELAIKYNIML